MKKSLSIFAISMCFSCSSIAEVVAEPFGLTMGTSLEELSQQLKLEPAGSFVYDTKHPPKEHSDFNDYSLRVTPKHGLCRVTAFTPVIKTNSFGNELKDKLNQIESALTSKYGRAEALDFLREGSIWNEPRDWMMALYKKERVLSAYWIGSQTNSSNLQAISLETSALSNDAALIALIYEFKNYPECLAWIKTQKNSSL